MLYVLRLTNGDCVVTVSSDEFSARQAALKLGQDKSAQVASIRPLSGFAMRLSPTEDGSLEVECWDDDVLDDILTKEYPLLYEAYRRANAEPFMQASHTDEPILSHLKSAYEQNIRIIREGLQLERQRYSHEASAPRSKTVSART